MKYKDLIIWQKSHTLTLKTIKVLKPLNRSYTGEIIGKQLLRAVTSIGANIAEGYGRHEGKEFIRSLEYSFGSSNEVDNWLMVAKDANIIPTQMALDLMKDNEEITKMLVATIKKTRGTKKDKQ